MTKFLAALGVSTALLVVPALAQDNSGSTDGAKSDTTQHRHHKDDSSVGAANSNSSKD
jgi:hypothetical protein